MYKKCLVTMSVTVLLTGSILSQIQDKYLPDSGSPALIPGMKLVWNDEFNNSGKPDPASWIYEKGFVRNQELQWYQQDNANCANGILTIEGRKDKINNPDFNPVSTDWKARREYAEYSAASIQTRGLRQWQFGRFEIRARIDTACGAWPAIWTLGISKGWPANGEIDIMEFYRVRGVPTLLANFAWGTGRRGVAKWDDLKKPLSDFALNDREWTKKFHIWRMDWNKDSINLFLDDQLLNTTLLSRTLNPDGFNPFLQPHYLLLNLALGANGGDPSRSRFPIKYEVDYVRVYQNITEIQDVPGDFINPAHEFSLMPFWFWNDTLKDEEILRQIADFEKHGVYGFVIHPRIGLPGNVKWLSADMIHSMDLAIQEASRRKMYVVLYDEGMYPSGSSSGQVVERNPEHAARGLAKIDLKPGEKPKLRAGEKLITVTDRSGGRQIAVIDQLSGGNIRGLHYIDEGGSKQKEESPPAGDILNPDAVTSFIELVYDRYGKEFGKYFSTTVLGIFTDEPSPLGRGSSKGLVPGNAALFPQINQILGYDITPFLADLWYNDNADSKKHRMDYNRAVNTCLEENYYKRLGKWCSDHGISLMGHPAGSMDIGAERYFQIPGQDLVWRYVEPGPTALEGQHSTMAKCGSSAMVHMGLRRNSNELYGAYGHNLTYDEMVWLAYWCFVRGQNLLIPHAFYYSIRGPRFNERPPDVGPNALWWNKYKEYADACRRLSWLNTDSKQVCDLAILCEANFLPDKSARICYQNQRDFNYLEIRHLWEDAKIDSNGIHIADMHYGVIVIDSMSVMPPEAIPLLKILADNGRLIINESADYSSFFKGAVVYKTPENLIAAINNITLPDITLTTSSEEIRYRHVKKGSDHYYIIFNEGNDELSTNLNISVKGNRQLINPITTEAVNISDEENVSFKPHELKVLRVYEE